MWVKFWHELQISIILKTFDFMKYLNKWDLIWNVDLLVLIQNTIWMFFSTLPYIFLFTYVMFGFICYIMKKLTKINYRARKNIYIYIYIYILFIHIYFEFI